MEKSIGEIIGVVTPEGQEMDQEVQVEEVGYQEEGQGFNFLDVLKAQTGPGSHDDEVYMKHPLNFNGSVAMARVLRGITGMFGEMRLAIIDVGIGTYQMIFERSDQDGLS